MKAAVSIVVLLILGISPAAGVAQSFAATAPSSINATPLIEVEARGIRTTEYDIPLCDVGCRNLDPHLISYRVAITTNGVVAGTLTEKKLEDQSSRAVARVFTGTATPAQMAALRTLLSDAKIGIEQGGCSTGFVEEVAQEPYPTSHGYRLAYSVLWFGKGNRINFFELPVGASFCSSRVRELMQHIVFVARDAQRRSR